MDLTEYLWVGWVVLIALFLVIEMTTLEFTCLMLAVGSVVGLVTALVGGELWLQLVLAAAASLLLILLLRPPLLRALRRGGDKAKSNVDALIGMAGVVVETVSRTSGRVKLANGENWSARTTQAEFAPGVPVSVTAIRGAVAEVESHREEGSF